MPRERPRPTKPRWPESYGLSKDAGPHVDWGDAVLRLSAARNYWVGSTGSDRRPYVAPVWGIWLDGVFCFSTAVTSRKGRNLRSNPAIAIHLESGDDVLILQGDVEAVTDASTFARYAQAYKAKYGWRPEFGKPGQVTYAVRPRAAFTWRERDFPTTATRWVFPTA